jgi:hypothetical protein
MFHAFAPSWQPLFWNLTDQPPEKLLESGEAWLQTLAVIRSQFAAAPEFEAIYSEVQRRLQELSGQDRVRWYDLQRILITWAQHRRPQAERAALSAPTLNAQADPDRRAEVEQMEKTIAQALIEEGEARGKTIAQALIEEGEAKGEAIARLSVSRSHLQRLLTKKFQNLSEDITRRIENTTDLDRLDACIDQVLDMQSLDELQL